MKRFFTLILSIVIIFTFTSTASANYTPSFNITAGAVYLYNMDSEMVIYEKNADDKLQPSALAQLMTVVVALEQVADIENSTATMKNYIQDEMYRKGIELGGIRLAGLYRNETLSIKNLLYAILIRDANEAAMMVADYVGDGSVPYFVELMNKRAAELGMNNTHFTNPTGLPDQDAYTTAKDMAILATHAMSLPNFSEMASTTSYNGGPTNINDTLNWNSTNRLIVKSSPYFNRYAGGIKSGYHSALGSYSISTAQKDGYTYLCIILNSTGLDEAGADNTMFSAFEQTNRLYNWAFETFKVKTLLEKGRNFGEIPLRLSWGKDFVRIMSADNFMALIPDAIEASSIQYVLDLPKYIEAPIEKGALVGQVRLILAEEQIGVVGIVAAESADSSRGLVMIQSLLNITRTFWFKFTVILLVVLIILYAVALVLKNHNKRRYGRRK